MTPKEEAKAKIVALVAKFKEEFNKPNSKRDSNETTNRNQYINPFFEALGWDINNAQNLPANYRDVTHETKQKVNGKTKAPDYLFRIMDTPKFFLEAKNLLVSVKTNSEHAKQIRQYGWSNDKTPVAILTNFEELAIYDCAYMHKDGDGAHVARLKFLHCEQYETSFDFLWDTLSKESVAQGSLEHFAQVDTVKKGAVSVDVAFLQSLNEWRMELASAIATENLTINEHDLNYAVQMTLDRLVFLRIAEDRGIEDEGRLQKLLISKNVYHEFLAYCKESDAKYNSGLFNFKIDTTTTKIKIPNKTLKFIIEDLYYPKSQYAFGVLPVEILGNVYEQFLGKVIVLKTGNIAKPEDKPEVRKAGGVYYTPEYVVKYIVQETVGKRIAEIEANLEEGQDIITEIAKLKIIDPACGSGSFLLGAYQFLLDWHLAYYHHHAPKDYSLLTPDGNLTAKVKKSILLNNIFGVDLDANAVEVTKLSLLLKAMEKETEASIKTTLSTYKERILPTLDSNILSGNSLVETDFFTPKIKLTLEQEFKLKAFHWRTAFSSVLKKGGFDIVIGNPPYVRIQTLTENQSVEVLEYYKSKYISGKSGNFDLYTLFTEKGYTLLNDNGILAFIEPHKFFQADFGEGLREFLVTKNALQKIVHFGAQQVFKNATTYTCLLFLDKQNNTHFELINVPKISEWAKNYTQSIISKVNLPILGEKWNFTDDKKQDVLNKIFQKSERLEQVTSKIFQGIPTGSDKIFVLEARKVKKKTILCFSQALNKEIEIETSLLKPFLLGKEVKRYEIHEPKYYVIFPYNLISNVATLMTEDYIAKKFPLGYAYLLENKSALENRENQRFIKTWWQYSRPQNLVNFAQEKIIVPDIANKPQFTLDNGNYHTTTIYSLLFDNNISEDKLYWLAFLNSKLMWFFMGYSGSILRGGFLRFKTEYLKPFPVKRIDFTNKIESQIHNNIIITAQNLLDSYIDLKNTNISNLRVNIEHKINGLENQINHWIFDLYNLDEIEREIILQS